MFEASDQQCKATLVTTVVKIMFRKFSKTIFAHNGNQLHR